MDVPVAANVLGTLGAVCWSVQLLPQIWLNWRRHNATGLQPTMVRTIYTCVRQAYLTDRFIADDVLGLGRRSSGRL